MESRDIYNLSKRTIEYEKEWIHIGTGDHIEKDRLSYHLTEHFKSYKTLFIKRGRLNSEEINTEILFEKCIPLIGLEDFEVWSIDFRKAIKFNKIGVLNKSENDA